MRCKTRLKINPMKKIFFCFLAGLLVGTHTHAQQTQLADGVKKTQLPVIYLPVNVSVHFISPEAIQYVDISAKAITGDLPLKNVLRIRLNSDTTGEKGAFDDAIVTITGEKFIAQYRVVKADAITTRDAVTDVEILPSMTRPLDISGIGLSENQLRTIALRLATRENSHPVTANKAFGIKGTVNNLYSFGDYLFLDLGYRNKTNLSYAIDEFRFKVDDKKITKASNVQSLEIRPECVLFNTGSFKRNYRNIFVFKKMSFPGNKVLHIELSEKQLSGRVIALALSYQDILDADVVPSN
jgi:conjugative transposon TraN protein